MPAGGRKAAAQNRLSCAGLGPANSTTRDRTQSAFLSVLTRCCLAVPPDLRRSRLTETDLLGATRRIFWPLSRCLDREAHRTTLSW